MPLRATYSNLLNDPLTASNTIASFTGPNDLIRATGASPGGAYVAQPCIIPVNYLKPGTTIRTEAFGTMADASTAPTMTLSLNWGQTPTVMAVSAATAETSAATVQCPWHFKVLTVVRNATVPSAVVTITSGWLLFGTSLTAVSTLPVPSTAMATVNVDNSAANELWVGATCSASAAGNTITVHALTYEELTQI